MPPDRSIEESTEPFERRLIGDAELQFGTLRGVRAHREKRMCGWEDTGSRTPTKLEGVVAAHGVRVIFDNAYRDVGRDEEFLDSAARYGAL